MSLLSTVCFYNQHIPVFLRKSFFDLFSFLEAYRSCFSIVLTVKISTVTVQSRTASCHQCLFYEIPEF